MDILKRIGELVGLGKTPVEAEKIAQDEQQALDEAEVLAAEVDSVVPHRDGSEHHGSIDASFS